MISHSHRWIFVPINRTASSSMQVLLEKDCSIFGVNRRGESLKHETILEAKRRLSKDQFSSYFKFAVVRNPWDRIISLYLYTPVDRKTAKQGYTRQKQYEELSPFVGLLLFNGDAFLKWLRNISTNRSKFLASCFFWLKNGQGEIGVDFVGKYEDLNKAWKYISNRIGLREESLGCLLRNKNRTHYRDYYDRVTEQLVGEIFAEDIARWEYKF